MRHLKIFEMNPAFYEDPPEPKREGADVEYPEHEQLFSPVFCHEGYPEEDKVRGEKGYPDFAIVMDKTPQKAIWVVRDIDDVIPESYLTYWETSEGGEHVQDTNSILNFATDEFKAGRWVDGFDAWDEDEWAVDLVKITTVEDVDSLIQDLSNFINPSHASYYGKVRNPKIKDHYRISHVPGEGEISLAKRAIRALEIYKRRIESNTVGGSTPA